jgi:hypothetical protein
MVLVVTRNWRKTALDYLIKVKNLSFIEAVENTHGQTAIKPSVFSYTQKDNPPEEKIAAT